MTKELIISANVHEKKVAILEDGQVTEFYVERRDENQGVVGNLYKGRVMKVLPGMQSAFVDIGLERDAFLYVSDFTEFMEEEDEIDFREAVEDRAAPPPPKPEERPRRGDRPHQEPVRGARPSSERTREEEAADTIVRMEDAVEQLAEIADESVIPPPPTEEEISEQTARLDEPAPAEVEEYFIERVTDEPFEPPAETAAAQAAEAPAAKAAAPAQEPKAAAQDEGRPKRRSRKKAVEVPVEKVEPKSRKKPARVEAKAEEKPAKGGARKAAARTAGKKTSRRRAAEEDAETKQATEEFHRITDEDMAMDAGDLLKDAILQEKFNEQVHKAEYSTSTFTPEPEPEWRVGSFRSQVEGSSDFQRVIDENAEGASEPESAGRASQRDESSITPFRHISEALPGGLLDKMQAGDASEIGEVSGIISGGDASADQGDRDAEVRDKGNRSEFAVRRGGRGRRRRPHQKDVATATDEEQPAAVAGSEDDGGVAEAQAPEEIARAADSRQAESRQAESRQAETRQAESRQAESRQSDSRPSDSRSSDTRSSDTRSSESRPVSSRQSDSRSSEARQGDARQGDTRQSDVRQGDARQSEPRSGGSRHEGSRYDRRPDGRRSDAQRRPEQRRPDGPPGRRPERALPPTISELLHEGQEILVQIAKEPIAKKGARITSHIALPGRLLVYMPTVNHVGVSRKIPNDVERVRLKRIVSGLREREGATGGFIARTACAGHTEQELHDDMRYLIRTWSDVRKKSERTKAPVMVHQDLDLVQRILRDQLSEEFTAIRIDNEVEYARIVEFVNRVQPRLVKRVKLYTGNQPIFEKYAVQPEIDKAVRPRVWLKSGGYIVINQTEALVAIDVNTGKFVGKSDKLEDTITRTNLEAVKEIVRQIRLRDLGGIIVLDLIDMEERKNRQRVMAALQQELQSDRAPSKILSINDFGLVAITRKRVKQSLERTLCAPCPYCQGAGMVKSAQTMCFEILEQAKAMSKQAIGNSDVMLRVSPNVAEAFRLSEKAVMEEIEAYFGTPVTLEADPNLHQEQYDFAVM
jgi:Rne/Rng family ribonuclease